MKGDRDNGRASTRPGGPKCSCCTKKGRKVHKYRRRVAKAETLTEFRFGWEVVE